VHNTIGFMSPILHSPLTHTQAPLALANPNRNRSDPRVSHWHELHGHRTVSVLYKRRGGPSHVRLLAVDHHLVDLHRATGSLVVLEEGVDERLVQRLLEHLL